MTLPAVIVSKLPETYTQHLSYRTDVIRAYNGLEWRQALLGSPRETWELSYLLTDAEVLAFRANLVDSMQQTVAVPAYERPLAATAAITTTSISLVITASDWPVIGDVVLVVNALDQSYAANVTNVVGTNPATVTVDASPPGGQSYPAGTTVYVLRLLQLTDGQGFTKYPVHEGTWNLHGLVTTYESTLGTGASLVTFDGLPVVDRGEAMPQATMDEKIVADLEMLDRGAKFYARTALAFSNLHRPFIIFMNAQSDRQWLRLFVQTVLGSQSLFLLPTWKPDVSVHTQPGVGATSLLVDSTPNYRTNWFPSPAHKRLQGLHADGSVEYLKVTAAVDNGNGTQTLTIAAPGCSGTAITMLSLLEQCRLDSDDVSITWDSTSGFAQLGGLVVPQ